jgi:hypothetical protein
LAISLELIARSLTQELQLDVITHRLIKNVPVPKFALQEGSMKRIGLSFVLIACLICPVLGFEKVGQNPLDEDPEILIGKVKKATVTANWFNKVDNQWVKESTSSITRKFPRNPIANQPDSDSLDSTTEEGEENFPEDPIKAQQSDGYNAGYGNSRGWYGFYKTDEKDNILETAHYSSDKKLISRDYYSYDADCKELEKSTVQADGSLAERVITAYNSQGKRTERITYAKDGTLEELWAWRYDEKNNITLETLHRKDSLQYKESSTYRYDRKGNYTRKESIKENFDNGMLNSQKMYVVERIISYYKK